MRTTIDILRCAGVGCLNNYLHPGGLINYAFSSDIPQMLCAECRPKLERDAILPPGSEHPPLLQKAQDMSHRWSEFLKRLEKVD
jgi:hypothetical protein